MISKPTSFSIFLNLTPPCHGALRQLPYIYRDASLSAKVLESAPVAWEEKLMDFSPTDNADETSTIFKHNGGNIQITKFASLSM